MEKRKIYPYIIEKSRIAGYYEILMDEGYKLKIFDKKKNKENYEWFLPSVRDYMFWTYNLIGDQKKEFENLSNDLKAIICEKYNCNIFEKKETFIICFSSGICFAITENEQTANKLKQYQTVTLMKTINLRDESNYKIPQKQNEETKLEENPEFYAYILQLYKMIYLNKIQKDLQEEDLFDKTRNNFVDFTEKIYNIEITDKKEGIEMCKKWEKALKLDEIYLKIDNEFDLLYKNNKLNYNKNLTTWSIVLFIIAIIIGMINLLNMI